MWQEDVFAVARAALIATADAAFARGKQRIDLRDRLAKLEIPVLTIWGGADAVVPVPHAQEDARLARGRLEVFVGCGHCPHIERAGEFNELVRAFLMG